MRYPDERPWSLRCCQSGAMWRERLLIVAMAIGTIGKAASGQVAYVAQQRSLEYFRSERTATAIDLAPFYREIASLNNFFGNGALAAQQSELWSDRMVVAQRVVAIDGLNGAGGSASSVFRVTFDLESRQTCRLIVNWATESDSYAGTGIVSIELVGPLGEMLFESRSVDQSSPEHGSHDLAVGLPPGRFTMAARVQESAGGSPGQWGAYESSVFVSAEFASWCTGDFNVDGGVDGQDIEEFFFAWEAARSTADVNTDGGVDGMDVQTFFEDWAQGC